MKYLHCILLLFAAFNTCWSQSQEPRILPGNTFNVRLSAVPQEDSLQVSQAYTLSSAGTFRLPYLDKEIQAAGLTCSELQNKIMALYKAAEIFKDPNVVVSVGVQTAEMVITVGGEVRNPSEVPFRPGIKLFAAISRCGGPTEYGDMRRVKLIRGKGEKVYDLRKVTADNNPELQAGDQVIVPGS